MLTKIFFDSIFLFFLNAHYLHTIDTFINMFVVICTFIR